MTNVMRGRRLKRRIRRGLSLYLLTADPSNQREITPDKVFTTSVTAFVGSLGDTFESPEITLSLEALVLALLEKSWKDFLDKLFGFVDPEGRLFAGNPRDNVLKIVVFGPLQNQVQFPWESIAVLGAELLSIHFDLFQIAAVRCGRVTAVYRSCFRPHMCYLPVYWPICASCQFIGMQFFNCGLFDDDLESPHHAGFVFVCRRGEEARVRKRWQVLYTGHLQIVFWFPFSQAACDTFRLIPLARLH
mmetsp:Transcript_2876/g.5184  ORF Transcript_2876/g.5184 Transcript_2876/m.5184 type:complete len:246 (+) Transcript_2876:603-1340(+)